MTTRERSEHTANLHMQQSQPRRGYAPRHAAGWSPRRARAVFLGCVALGFVVAFVVSVTFTQVVRWLPGVLSK